MSYSVFRINILPTLSTIYPNFNLNGASYILPGNPTDGIKVNKGGKRIQECCSSKGEQCPKGHGNGRFS